MSMKIFAQRAVWNDAIELRIGFDQGEGRFSVALPVSWQSVPRGELSPEGPMLRLQQIDAQRLMDELWHCGLRPSEGSGTAGSLAATERHLKDMRQIAFTVLDIGEA